MKEAYQDLFEAEQSRKQVKTATTTKYKHTKLFEL